MNQCAPIFFAQFGTPTATQFWIFLACLFTLVGGAIAVLKLRNEWHKSRESDEPKRRLLPMPIVTRSDDPPVAISVWEAQIKRRDVEIKDMEGRIERKIDEHEKLVRQRLQEVFNEAQGAATEAKEGREVATEQFQKIEGQLGELRSTSAHTNALAIRTDQAVREIPEKIAAAVARNRR